MNRRDFFKFLPFAPAVVPITAIAIARESDEPKRNLLTLVMQDDLMRPTDSNDRKVDLSIGKDGHLWVRAEKDNWKKVVTE